MIKEDGKIYTAHDCMGSYEVDPSSLLATAPRRKDGMWDLRTRLGQDAYCEFLDNEKRRIEGKI